MAYRGTQSEWLILTTRIICSCRRVEARSQLTRASAPIGFVTQNLIHESRFSIYARICITCKGSSKCRALNLTVSSVGFRDVDGRSKCMGIDVTITRTFVAPVALAILAIASLEACAKRKVPPLAELPPSTLPAPPAPRPAVEQNQAQGELAAIGAIQTVQGWTLPIANAKFRAGRLVIEPGDRRIDEVVTTLKNRPRLRVLIEAHVDQKGSNRHARSISQRYADEVLRALTAKGVEGSRIQAQGRANAFTGLPGDPSVMLIFSNAEGEFASTALAP